MVVVALCMPETGRRLCCEALGESGETGATFRAATGGIELWFAGGEGLGMELRLATPRLPLVPNVDGGDGLGRASLGPNSCSPGPRKELPKGPGLGTLACGLGSSASRIKEAALAQFGAERILACVKFLTLSLSLSEVFPAGVDRTRACVLWCP